jgi:hypothetical protein
MLSRLQTRPVFYTDLAPNFDQFTSMLYRKLKKSLLYLFMAVSHFGASAQTTIVKYLSGTDKDHTATWDFYCTGGRNSGKWTKIQVPSNWELQGFGEYNYGHDKIKSNEQGIYRHNFVVGNEKGKRIFIVFEGSMTDTKVMINGIQAGDVHQGSFYRFKYDITDLVKPSGNNLLEVTVAKTSANESVNDAERRNSDFWVFGGIFRPVYLEIVPETFIDRLAIDAKADGSFSMAAYPERLKGGEMIEAQVQTLRGINVSKAFSVKADSGRLTAHFDKPSLWNAESPNLYQVLVSLKRKGQVIHQVRQRFGFRTVELRQQDGLYVNGAKIILKGCNRHSFWPETGRTLSRDVHLMDVRLMKEMNMNAVRMSHYPPDQVFLDICDSLGLYVLDELTGWQAKYDTVVGRKLVKELVIRDVNHPSILAWDNGNEGGWNRGLDHDYALYDPQDRIVLHPWEKFNGTDTKHYPDYNYVSNAVATGKEVFFPTEFMHGLYDGGAGAGLDDFWSLMMQHPHAGGGFIWAFLDEAVIRTDKNNSYDADGNHAPDGIVGPHREKEGSFYTIKEIWSPVHILLSTIDEEFTGKIPVENRYAFTNISQCRFRWQLVKFPGSRDLSTASIVTTEGFAKSVDIKPSDKGVLNLPLTGSWRENDALYLTAYGPDKKEIFTWSWKIPKKPIDPAKRKAGTISVAEDVVSLRIECDSIIYHFDKSTGYLQKIVKPHGVLSLSGGPALAGSKDSLASFRHQTNDGAQIVEVDYQGSAPLHIKWTFRPGQPAELTYQYMQSGPADFSGISFNYPEKKITGMKWLGRGPYRVWKNRLKGERLGVWHKAYNNTITGETWDYPEFKGYHDGVEWVVVENTEFPFTIYMEDGPRYLQMLHPAREKAALTNNNVEPAFPDGDIGILDGISAIGTKFQRAEVMGPQSRKNQASDKPVNGRISFDFK